LKGPTMTFRDAKLMSAMGLGRVKTFVSVGF